MTGQHIKILLIQDNEEDYLLTRDLLKQASDMYYLFDWIEPTHMLPAKIRRTKRSKATIN